MTFSKIFSLACTGLLGIGFVLSGCTQSNTPMGQSDTAPSTGRSMVRGVEESPVVEQRSLSEQMRQCEDVMKQSLNTVNAPYDQRFIDTMIRQHQASIDLARNAQQNAQHEEIKSLAQSIIDTKQNEIAKLQEWRKQWYGSEQRNTATQ